jgi:hypothetical protein
MDTPPDEEGNLFWLFLMYRSKRCFEFLDIRNSLSIHSLD